MPFPRRKKKKRKRDNVGAAEQLFASAIEIAGDIKYLSMKDIKRILKTRLRGMTGFSGPSQKMKIENVLPRALFLYKNYLTQGRIALIKKYSDKYDVSAELIAARILYHQDAMNYVYDKFDYFGGILGGNTTMGLGKIKVSNVRKLFPEKFSGRSDAEITKALANEEFNIECVAKYFNTIRKEGRALLGREPSIRELGSRYTSSDYYSALDCGMGTEKIMFEVQILDPFNSGRSKVALKKYYKLIDELNKKS